MSFSLSFLQYIQCLYQERSILLLVLSLPSAEDFYTSTLR
jgi:hypothetical protein